ncbi:hypothetical protein BDD12DRAFT_799267 [Trichophaea hybrida]|nr:hypothetical protein BDD12DRAFT_799267 [Trichophaea hybrida]
MSSCSPKTTVCIIGAGWFGLVTAKTYLQIDPTIALTILESSSSLGGTWNRSRVHPYLLAQQRYGAYEFADLPIPTDDVSDLKTAFIPSEILHACMQTYAEKFGVADKVRFNTTVTGVEKDGDGWAVWIGDKRERFDKLIMATGLTSTPVIPEIPREGFTAEVFHTANMGEKYEWLVSDKVSRVAIYGGGKSAQDAVYLCVKHGKQVDWIIRPDSVGNGAEPLYPTTLLGKTGNGAMSSRFAAAQQPSLDLLDNWSYWFFHSGKSRLGSWIHWTWWGYICKKMVDFAGYDKSENMKKLKPQVTKHGGFWASLPASLANQPTFIPLLHAGDLITVHRATITHLSSNNIFLSPSSPPLQTDALILATGYHPTCTIPSPAIPPTTASTAALDARAEAEVLRLFPRLKQAPTLYKIPSTQPFRLYNRIVPPEMIERGDRSFAFVGAVRGVGTAICAEATALWAAAWLSGNLEVGLSREEMEWDVAMRNAFSRKRYAVSGAAGTCVLYEYLPMVDHMLRQLGVEHRRKRDKGRMGEFMEPYFPRDYRGWWRSGYRGERGLVQNEFWDGDVRIHK